MSYPEWAPGPYNEVPVALDNEPRGEPGAAADWAKSSRGGTDRLTDVLADLGVGWRIDIRSVTRVDRTVRWEISVTHHLLSDRPTDLTATRATSGLLLSKARADVALEEIRECIDVIRRHPGYPDGE